MEEEADSIAALRQEIVSLRTQVRELQRPPRPFIFPATVGGSTFTELASADGVLVTKTDGRSSDLLDMEDNSVVLSLADPDGTRKYIEIQGGDGDDCSTDSPVEIGTSDEGDETPDATEWDISDGVPLNEWYLSRVGYWHGGGQILWGYARMRQLDSCGKTYHVSGEVQYEIDMPEVCDEGE